MAEDLTRALQVGQRICWDETHGYYLRGSQPGVVDGELNPDVDCSYFVGYCLQQGGFNVSPSWYTGSMITTLRNYPGFTEYIWQPGFQWKNGDIAVYDEGGGERGHTFFYVENMYGYTATDWRTAGPTKSILLAGRMEAAGSHNHPYPETGDQDNGYGAHTEVWIHGYYDPDSSHTWHIFRWQDTPGPIPPGPTPGNIPTWLLIKLSKHERGGYYYGET